MKDVFHIVGSCFYPSNALALEVSTFYKIGTGETISYKSIEMRLLREGKKLDDKIVRVIARVVTHIRTEPETEEGETSE